MYIVRTRHAHIVHCCVLVPTASVTVLCPRFGQEARSRRVNIIFWRKKNTRITFGVFVLYLFIFLLPADVCLIHVRTCLHFISRNDDAEKQQFCFLYKTFSAKCRASLRNCEHVARIKKKRSRLNWKRTEISITLNS